MKKRTIPTLLLLLAVLLGCLRLPAEAVDGGQRRQTLQGKTLLILGDSYCAGYGLERREDAWPYQMAEQWDMDYIDHAISGSTFASGSQSSAPMVERVKELTGQRVDIIIVQGASNDWAHNIPVGETDSRDPETAMGALNGILDTLEQAHPEATLICFTPWISNGAKNDLGLETTAYHDAMLTLCRERNILCYDAADARQNGIHMDDGTFRTEYCLTPTDRWHMNPKGQAMFAPVFSAWLQKTLYGEAEPADRFADLISASEPLREAVGQLVQAGIMRGTSDTLFSPARAATVETLAVTLYRLAGSPGRDPSVAAAVQWAGEQGILSESSRLSSSLNRETLAWGLYQYHKNWLSGQVNALAGLGGCPDRNELEEEYAVAFAWAVQTGLISLDNGHVKPHTLVSRGQLALTLCKMQEIGS